MQVFFTVLIAKISAAQAQLQKKSEEVEYMRESLAKLKSTLEQERRLNVAIKQKKVGSEICCRFVIRRPHFLLEDRTCHLMILSY